MKVKNCDTWSNRLTPGTWISRPIFFCNIKNNASAEIRAIPRPVKVHFICFTMNCTYGMILSRELSTYRGLIFFGPNSGTKIERVLIRKCSQFRNSELLSSVAMHVASF